MRRFALLSLFLPVVALFLAAQDPKTPKPPEVENAAPQEPPEAQPDFTCPMDPDVKQKAPGKCPRCGMALVAGIPDALEYPVKLKTAPARLQAGANAQLTLWVNNPKTGKQETKFQIVHDKYFHLFLLSQDLKHFAHEHPEVTPDKKFVLDFKFPAPGYYRVLSDFYPEGGAPQMVANSVFVPGPGFQMGVAKLQADVNPQQGANMKVSLRMEPEQAVAGLKTLMFFTLDPGDGLEQYLAAWGHMLAASWDSIDMVHNHPFIADGGPNVQFNMIFPRAGIYRVWVQFQRKGVVNTVAFNVPVKELQ